MKKETKKLNNIIKLIKILTIILAIILISMISFIGIYTQNKGIINNKVKDYQYTMGVSGARTLKLVLAKEDTEETTNSEEENNSESKSSEKYNTEDKLTVENYKKVKEIIEKRLKTLKVEEYIINLNEKTGEITVQIPENDMTDTVVGNLITVGKFEISDSETGEVLLSNEHIKSSGVLYNTTSKGTTIYLDIKFDKKGKEKLEEISKIYVETEETSTETEDESTETSNEENENDEEKESEEKKTKKEIKMKIDDDEVMTTSFDEPITTGRIQLSVGAASTEANTVQGYATQAGNMAAVLDSGNLPLKYDLEKNQYIISEIEQKELLKIAIIVTIITIISIVILIVKYKAKGLLTGISYIGLIALYTTIIRYTNVLISIESIFGIIIALVLNYILTWNLLNNIEKAKKENLENPVNKATLKTYSEFFISIIPIILIAIIFSFIKWIPISSFGMVTVWGLLIIAIYNAIITKTLIKSSIED